MNAYELRVTVAPGDIDGLGHVNNTVYLRWVQEVAIAHWEAVVSPADQAAIVWVVVRHEIDYRKPAWAEDEILLRTWVGKATRLTFERFTEIVRGPDRQLLAQARTLWCPVDPESFRPKRVSPELREQFSTGQE
jgi:acyl-CoA thioester hydrolase